MNTHLKTSMEATSKNSYFVMPAKAGIQFNQTTGCRIKSGMTNCKTILTGMANMPPLMMKPAMPVSLSPTLSRKRARGQANRYASFTLISLALTIATPAHAEELGRLFFTPEHRAKLEREHTRTAAAEDGSSSSVLTVNGIVQKHGGERTVWINGVPQLAGNSDELAPESVPVAVPGQSQPVKVKVGQKLLLDSVPEHKPAPQHPTDAGDNDD